MTRRVVRIITRLNRGGPLRQLQALEPRLAAHGWRSVVLSGRPPAHEGDGAEALVHAGARVVRVPALGRPLAFSKDARAWRELAVLLRRLRPDVVHTHLGKAGALGRLAARAVGVPAVHTFHGHHFASPGISGAAARRVERALAPATRAWIALSRSQADDVRRVVGPRHAARVRVIAPGLDVDCLRARVAPRQPSEPGAPLRVLWLGRLVPVKRVDLLVEAVHRMRRAATLTLLGDGPLRPEVATRSSARVRLVGEVSDPAPWLGRADVVALASRTEGTPMALLEGMAVGLPVVAPRVGGIPDVVAHDRHGLLVPPGDAGALAAALDRLARDAALRARLGRAGAAHAQERFGAARLAAATAALYDGLVQPRTRMSVEEAVRSEA